MHHLWVVSWPQQSDLARGQPVKDQKSRKAKREGCLSLVGSMQSISCAGGRQQSRHNPRIVQAQQPQMTKKARWPLGRIAEMQECNHGTPCGCVKHLVPSPPLPPAQVPSLDSPYSRSMICLAPFRTLIPCKKAERRIFSP